MEKWNMKIICPAWITVICLFCISCEQSNKGLIHTVSDFGVPISCISPSSENDSIFFIGLENGNIIRINLINNSRTIINAGNNRIYDICAENDTTLLVGIRNEGVKRIQNGIVKKKYYILNPLDITKPTDSYAAYTIKTDGDSFYFATSSGIYTLNKNEWETELLLHPYYRPENHSLFHFGVNHLSINDINIYVATSDSGLVVLNKNNPKESKRLIDKDILHFYKYNDSILYASSGNSTYKINTKQSVAQQKATLVKSDSHGIFAYMVDSLDRKQREWVLTSSEMKYTDNKNGSGSLQLSDKLSSSYKNYVCKGKDFILVACHNKLYIFSLHQNPKGESNNVIAVCMEKSNRICYFITLDNKLYSESGEKDYAKFIGKLSLTIREKPVRFHAGKKYLWLITNNSLYKINPGNAKTSREIGISGSEAKWELGRKIDFRSVYEDKESLLLGTRNYLLRAKYINDEIKEIDSIPTAKSTKVDFSDLYITDISGQYLASMKHGIFELNGTDSLNKISGSDTIGEIRRFIEESNRFIYLYTSRGVYEWGKHGSDFRRFPGISPKTISTVYYGNKSSYIIGYKGIERIPLDFTSELNLVDKHLDISVNEAAIAETADKNLLFVGTQIGLYKYRGYNDLTLVEIPPRSYAVLYFTLLPAGIAILIAIVILLYLYRKQHIKTILRRCNEKITKNTKKKKGDELILEKDELENKLKSVSLLGIRQLKKEVINFEIRVEESLLKRMEIIDSFRILLNSKIDEINKVISSDNRQDEWNNILCEKNKLENDYSIDYSFELLNRILEFEKSHLKKAVITQEMTGQQQKDFEELRNLFIARENGENTENEPESGEKQKRAEEKRNRIKLKCEELSNKYSEELSGLKLKNNSKKSYVALLLISGKFDNADIEETMNFNRVGDDRYHIHENLKQQANRNALLEQLYENTTPSK
ncbi:ligand-binding sensor domain-containing protein [Viscerimonas tarda]